MSFCSNYNLTKKQVVISRVCGEEERFVQLFAAPILYPSSNPQMMEVSTEGDGKCEPSQLAAALGAVAEGKHRVIVAEWEHYTRVEIEKQDPPTNQLPFVGRRTFPQGDKEV